jgi:L-amino acid N-acyltransferase YncA
VPWLRSASRPTDDLGDNHGVTHSAGRPLTIRPAGAAHAKAITAIYNHAVLHTTASYDLEPTTVIQRVRWILARLRSGLPVLACTPADDPDTVLGWASYGPYRDKPGFAQTVEHSVYVDPSVARAGVGSALLEALIEDARTRGFHVMIGVVDADNAGSIAFHERHGFTAGPRLREVGRKFDRWLDIVFVQLVLSAD